MGIGSTIREIRKSKGLTQIEVAEKAKISVNSLRLYEAEKRQPNIEQIKAIYSAMDEKITINGEENIKEGERFILAPNKQLVESMELDDYLIKLGFSFAHYDDPAQGSFWICSHTNSKRTRRFILSAEDIAELKENTCHYLKSQLISTLERLASEIL